MGVKRGQSMNMVKEEDILDSSILIIDDEVSLRNTFRVFLTRAGYTSVVTVATYDEALHSVAEQDFDLIFCDIVLERHSGIDLLKIFRENGVSCPVVIITGHPQVDTASEAVRLGAYDYLAKPVEKEAILKTARLAISHYWLQRKKEEAETSQAQANTFLETVFASVSDAIVVVDGNLKVIKANGAASRLLAGKPSEPVENLTILREPREKWLEELAELAGRVLKTGKGEDDHRLECCCMDGDSLLMSCCLSPLEKVVGADKGISGVVIVLRDITYKLKNPPKKSNRFHKMIGASPVMQELYTLLANVGKVDTSVLITGESGTGKELAALALHEESSRNKRQLVRVDCTAIPDDLLESELFGHKKGAFTGASEDRKGRILQAHGGTLFLDEIGDISKTMQLRLLRFLQEKSFYPVGRDCEQHVDVRVVAATNADLEQKVRAGSFREDLYYRLHVIEIRMPSLIERQEDIPLLTERFIHHFAAKTGRQVSGITDRALSRLSGYHWPGNVRELEHVVERACVLCDAATISSEHLPPHIPGVDAAKSFTGATGSTSDDLLAEHKMSAGASTDLHPESYSPDAEKIINALRKAGGNKAKAARLLKIDRSTLYRKIAELRIDTDIFSF